MRIALNGGAYTARSVIASAQRAVNIYPETNPPNALETAYGNVSGASDMTHYNAPGLAPLGAAPGAAGRCLYWANNDALYYVAGNTVYSVSPAWVLTALGQIGTSTGIVSMADNGTTLVIVDGSLLGYQVTLATNHFSQITEANNAPTTAGGGVFAFYGADRVDIIDGFMIFNQPGTQNFYSTYTNEVVFDALYFAAKNGYSDLLVSVIVTKREIWLIGERTTEMWSDVGAADFPFQIIPGPFIQHGCSAKWSVAQVDGAVFWLSQDQAGQNILARGAGYQAQRISTHALEAEWATYPTTTDAQGFCFQFGGHSFYQINFPTANKSWRWDESTKLWHEPVYFDADGGENRHRASCAIFAYGLNVAADWQTGQLYHIDPDTYTDNGMPMYWRRGFPHQMQDSKRVIYPGFVLDVEAATSPMTQRQPGPDPLIDAADMNQSIDAPLGGGILAGPAPINTSPQVLLRWSDTRGRTWQQPVAQSLGATGQYLTQVKWWRLGMARDRVFEAFGVIPGRLAINGAFLDPEPIKMGS